MKKRERSEKSRYKHQSTGDHCTCAAYIAEMMCMRNAEFKNQGSLPYKFWNTKAWSWTFKKQVFAANKLIKEYGESAVIKAVLSPELSKVFSLSNNRVLPVIKKYKLAEQQEVATPKATIEIAENIKTRKTSFTKKTKLDKLRELDG